MKKLMTIAAAALCASVFADGIQSANVVGYQTTSLLPNNYTMFGIQFQGTDGGSIKFKDLSGNFQGDETMYDADNILVWLDGSYHNYYYGVWNDPENPDWDNRWYDSLDTDASDVEIDAGTACWYLRRGDGDVTLTVSGQVKTTPTTTTILANNYTMFSNPYPTAIKFSQLSVANPYGDETMYDADNILVWLEDGYHNYYYGVWNDPENPDWDNRWYDSLDTDASDVVIPAGAACWYYRRTNTATTMSFKSPLAE